MSKLSKEDERSAVLFGCVLNVLTTEFFKAALESGKAPADEDLGVWVAKSFENAIDYLKFTASSEPHEIHHSCQEDQQNGQPKKNEDDTI